MRLHIEVAVAMYNKISCIAWILVSGSDDFLHNVVGVEADHQNDLTIHRASLWPSLSITRASSRWSGKMKH